MTLPSYDPANYESADVKLYEDPVVSHEYEPGSVFKVITMAAGLDAGVITPDTTFEDTGSFEIAGVTIKNWDREAHGLVTMTDVLAMSLNTGASWVSSILGPDRFYDYLSAFGFGQRLGVDLQAEAVGNTKRPGDGRWYEADLATNAFGQGIAVTPLQMISAVSAVANDGWLMRPTSSSGRTPRVRQTEPKPRWKLYLPRVPRPHPGDAGGSRRGDHRAGAARLQWRARRARHRSPSRRLPSSDIIASFVGFFPASESAVHLVKYIYRRPVSGAVRWLPCLGRGALLAVLLGIEPQGASSEWRQGETEPRFVIRTLLGETPNRTRTWRSRCVVDSRPRRAACSCLPRRDGRRTGLR